MKIAVIGSRTFNNYEIVKEELTKIENISLIVSGGAKGADSLGVKFAKENNIPYKEFLPDWNKHGKSAGFIRNHDIIKNSELVVAFWDGKSKGTKHSIDLARKMNIELKIVINEKNE